jgi:hypothetical protein
MNFRQLIQRNKDMVTVFGAFCGRVDSVRKAFWMRIHESHQRPVVQLRRFVLLDTGENQGPYSLVPVRFRFNIAASSVV